ncbi:MAG: DnaB-like helicase C-terminal domain-containing protein [Acutalibacteraceae bacterium]
MKTQDEVAKSAEMCIIGAILIDEKALANVIQTLKPEHFYFDELKATYQAILELSSEGKSIDFVSVLKKLVAKGIYDEKQAKQMLFECADLVPSVSQVESYAKTVIDSFKARRLQEIGTRLAFDGVFAENVDEVSEGIMSELYEVVSEQHKKQLKTVGDIGTKVFEGYSNDGQDVENRSHTGFSRLDEILKGMSAGNLIILAARPKLGKTAFALSIAENVAKSGKTVAFYSMEMESSEIYERLLSKRAQIPMNTLIDRRFRDKRRPQKIRDEEINKIAETIDEIYSLPIKINDNPACTVNDIRLESKLIKNLGLIVIDYLQLMRSKKRFENRNLEVGSICRELKCLASDLGVPILCLSQLNRTSDESTRPSPSELRDSGSIEQDANKVILMWSIEKNLNERGLVESKTIGVDVALNRRGTTGVTLFNFNGNYMNFTELDRKYEEPKAKKNWR